MEVLIDRFSLALEENKQKLDQLTKELEEKNGKLNKLLAEDLPPQIKSSMDAGNVILPREFDEVSILYADVPNFLIMLENYTPSLVIAALDELFIRFGRLVELHDIFKINGIAESYLAVGGVPEPKEDHAETILHIALGMEWKARQVTIDTIKNEPLLNSSNLSVLCGIHCGPVIAGIVELGSSQYCIFGETIEKATRLALNTNAGRILVSKEAKQCAQRTGRFEFEDFGSLKDVENEPIDAFYLKKSFKKSVWEIISRERDENINSIDGYLELNEVLKGDKSGERTNKAKICRIL